MSVSLVDLKQAIGNGMNIRQIKLMIGHQTYEVFFEDFETPGKTVSLKKVWGRYILDGLNAEPALIAAACTGDGHWFLECARNYAGEGVVFDRFIGQTSVSTFLWQALT